MNQHGSWSPYAGSGSLILAAILFIVTCVLVYGAMRLRRPLEVKRPGKGIGAAIVVIWLLSVVTFLVAVIVYVRTLQQQVGHLTGAPNPITPVTETCGIVAFVVIAVLARRSGFWTAFGSAIVGAIAAPMIFELPFDLIVMWRTYPPNPAALFTLLFFLPLFIVEIASFAMLMLSPVMKVSRYTLLLLAAMFLIFALWALSGFGYPLTPLPTAFNMASKVVAFAAAISLFLPQGKSEHAIRQNPRKALSEVL